MALGADVNQQHKDRIAKPGMSVRNINRARDLMMKARAAG
jgi:hypothetical protein